MNKMATLGHGPSKSTCPDCYGVNITTDSPSLVNIHLTGRNAYQGIVLLVKDAHTNKTVGEFQDFDENLFTSVACDDDEDEEDQIEPDSLAVLGHIDPKLKGWPVNVGWNMEAVKPITRLKLQGMIVIDYDNFHLLPETFFKIKRTIMPTKTATTKIEQTTVVHEETVTATETVIEIEHPGTMVKQPSNELFTWVFLVCLFFYFGMSLCYQQLVKRRSTQKILPDEINLVATNLKNV
ncbi:hypothetical protein BD560DRAFT_403501 [Blakeslea trispora]|nr:hypothetical protein BD560DRAFT_403501 [Blakeslea trispora]